VTLCRNINLLPISNVSCVIVILGPDQDLSLETNGCSDRGITDLSLVQSGSSLMFVFLGNLLFFLSPFFPFFISLSFCREKHQSKEIIT